MSPSSASAALDGSASVVCRLRARNNNEFVHRAHPAHFLQGWVGTGRFWRGTNLSRRPLRQVCRDSGGIFSKLIGGWRFWRGTNLSHAYKLQQGFMSAMGPDQLGSPLESKPLVKRANFTPRAKPTTICTLPPAQRPRSSGSVGRRLSRRFCAARACWRKFWIRGSCGQRSAAARSQLAASSG